MGEKEGGRVRMDGGRCGELQGAGKRSFLCEEQRAGEVNSARSANFAFMPASLTSTADFQNKINSFSVHISTRGVMIHGWNRFWNQLLGIF